MPKLIKKKARKKFIPKRYPATVHSTETFWNTKSFISSGKERYPLGNAYFIDEHGFRHYCLKFRKGITVYIDPDRTYKAHHNPSERTGRQLLDRFYSLKLKPLAFKWVKAKSSLETNHWICVYPAHYLVKVEQSEKGGMHTDDHLATLYVRSDRGLIAIALQYYEGHLKGNFEYSQPEILQEELREWRLTKCWYQDASIRDATFEV